MKNQTNIPPGYKPSPLGPIPQDWEVKELLNVFEFINTPSFSRENLTFDNTVNKVYYIHYGDIHATFDSELLDVEVETRIPFLKDEFCDTKLNYLREGDLVIADASEDYDGVGECVEIKNIANKKVVGGLHTIVLRDKSNASVNGFRTYIFRHHEVAISLKRIATGISVFGISKGNLAHIKLPIPPLPEQKAIADVLSTWDEAIKTTSQLIKAKEQRKQYLMQTLLTGKKRLKGFEGEWKKEIIGQFLVKHNEKTTRNNQYPVLTSSRNGIFLQKDYYSRDVASEDNTGYNVVPRGYFTYRHMSDDLIFKFNINEIVDKGIVSTLYPVFTVKNIDKYFLWCKLNYGSEFKNFALEQKQGGSRTYVYYSKLEEMAIKIPSLKEQSAIAAVLQTADAELQLLNDKLTQLKHQKKGLMQQLLTGKKRLNINKN